MKALTLNTQPLRWFACKAIGRWHKPIFWSPVSNLRYREIPEPKLPGENWVKLRTVLGGICGTDMALITQRTHPATILRPFTSFPIVLGHENVAVVESTGRDVTAWKPGDRVVVEPALSCVPRGIDPPCKACAEGLFSLCANYVGGNGMPAGTMIGLNAFTGGSWSPHFVAHESQLHTIPTELTDEQAVLIDPLACSLHAVLRRPPQPKERVLVQGAGIIGLGVVLTLRALGYDNEVIALARHQHQVDRLMKSGATHVVRCPRKKPRADIFDELGKLLDTRRVSSLFGNHTLLGGADLVYECSGTGLGLSDAIKLSAARGTVVAAGTSQINIVDTTSLWFREVSVIGAYGRQFEQIDDQARHTYEIIIEMIKDGRLSTDGLLTHTFKIQEYKKAFAAITRRSDIPVVKAAFRHE